LLEHASVVRICIVRLGAFGDIVHSLPLADDLHRAGLEVDWLCEDRWAGLLDGSPALGRIWRLPRGRWRRERPPLHRCLGDLAALVRPLRQRGYEAVIDAQGLLKSALLAAAIGAPVIGHAAPRAREGSPLLYQHRQPCRAEHVIDQQRALALPLLGRRHPRGDWRFPLPAWPEAEARMAAWLAGQGLRRPWALNVGAGWPSKLWPLPCQEAFLRLLVGEGRRPLILWGGAQERTVAEGLAAAVPGSLLAPPTDLPELACLLRHCGLLVSGDTGPLHLARAVGCPAIGLFGPVPASRNGVRGAHWANFQAPAKP
jgi:heptosyltransferase-1